jgi:hypothetical protein
MHWYTGRGRGGACRTHFVCVGCDCGVLLWLNNTRRGCFARPGLVGGSILGQFRRVGENLVGEFFRLWTNGRLFWCCRNDFWPVWGATRRGGFVH